MGGFVYEKIIFINKYFMYYSYTLIAKSSVGRTESFANV